MSNTGPSTFVPNRPIPHDCPPGCPIMETVIAQHEVFVERGDFGCSSIEEWSYRMLQELETIHEIYDPDDADFYTHSVILANTYGKQFAEKLARGIVQESPEGTAYKPHLKGPKVKGKIPLKSSYIREILASIGYPSHDSQSLTNEEAASILLENMEQIRALAHSGRLSRLELTRIKFFAMDNIDALEERKAKKGKRK